MEGSDPRPGRSACNLSRWNEADHIAALVRYRILDTPRERSFEETASIAAELLGAPVAPVIFVSDIGQWSRAEARNCRPCAISGQGRSSQAAARVTLLPCHAGKGVGCRRRIVRSNAPNRTTLAAPANAAAAKPAV